MKNTKTTKRALLSSFVALFLCVAMLAGTTFAWFTDSASTGVNKIQSGNLDVQLLMYDGTEYVDISDDTRAIFGTGSIAQNNNAETLWEPGKTQVAYLAIKNNGNLALKYKMVLDVTNVSGDLYEVMEYAITPDATNTNPVTAWISGDPVVVGNQPVSGEVSLAVGATHYFALSVHMKEDAGNTYQNGEVDFDLTVYATQDSVESDSFGNQYDKDLPLVQVSNVNELKDAIENGGDVMLMGNIDAGSVAGSKISIVANTTINGNGNTLSTNDPNREAYVSRVIDMTGQNDVKLTIADATITGGTSSGTYPYLYRGISLYQNTNPVLNILNSNVTAGHYAVNIAGANTNATINVDNSSLCGYAAFQTWSANTTATFTNSTLSGLNQWNGDNDFATVVVNEDASDSVLTFDNCVFEATEMGSAIEKIFSLRTDCVVKLNGCTFVKNGVEVSVAEIFANLQKTTDEWEDIYNDYITVYGGTNVEIYIDGNLIDLVVA